MLLGHVRAMERRRSAVTNPKQSPMERSGAQRSKEERPPAAGAEQPLLAPPSAHARKQHLSRINEVFCFDGPTCITSVLRKRQIQGGWSVGVYVF